MAPSTEAAAFLTQGCRMPRTPEDRARARIEAQLIEAGWLVQDANAPDLGATRGGIALAECPLKRGHGTADYLRPETLIDWIRGPSGTSSSTQAIRDLRGDYQEGRGGRRGDLPPVGGRFAAHRQPYPTRDPRE
jgi:hypothetical protein